MNTVLSGIVADVWTERPWKDQPARLVVMVPTDAVSAAFQEMLDEAMLLTKAGSLGLSNVGCWTVEAGRGAGGRFTVATRPVAL